VLPDVPERLGNQDAPLHLRRASERGAEPKSMAKAIAMDLSIVTIDVDGEGRIDD
jgi:hypothetical protein